MKPSLAGGFKYCQFSPLPGEMIQFDEHIFQMGRTKPPTRYNLQPILFAHETNAIRDNCSSYGLKNFQASHGLLHLKNQPKGMQICKSQSLRYLRPENLYSLHIIYYNIHNLHNKKHLQRLLFGWLRKAPKQSETSISQPLKTPGFPTERNKFRSETARDFEDIIWSTSRVTWGGNIWMIKNHIHFLYIILIFLHTN